MRSSLTVIVAAGVLVSACGPAPAPQSDLATGPGAAPGDGSGGGTTASFPLPSYWGAASQFAVPATISASGAAPLTLRGGAFGVTDTMPGQPGDVWSPAIWVGYGDPISGVEDGVFAWAFSAVFRPLDGHLGPRTLTGADVDGHVLLYDRSASWAGGADVLGDVVITLSSVEMEGSTSPDARRAGTYWTVHGTMSFSIPQVSGDPAGPERLEVRF